MLRPNPTTQEQFIIGSKEGKAFAYRDFCEEFRDCGANALPLQVTGAVSEIAYKRSRSSGSPLGTFANTFSNASQLTRLDFSAK